MNNLNSIQLKPGELLMFEAVQVAPENGCKGCVFQHRCPWANIKPAEEAACIEHHVIFKLWRP